MEDLPLGRIAALVPEFAVKDLPLGRTHDDDDDDDTHMGTLYITHHATFLKRIIHVDNAKRRWFAKYQWPIQDVVANKWMLNIENLFSTLLPHEPYGNASSFLPPIMFVCLFTTASPLPYNTENLVALLEDSWSVYSYGTYSQALEARQVN